MAIRDRLSGAGIELDAIRSALHQPVAAAVVSPGDDLQAQLKAAAEAAAAPLSTPVQRKPKRPGMQGSMFVLEDFVPIEPVDDHVDHGDHHG